MVETRVVNLRHNPYEVYIGRPGKGQSGYFGNPIRANEKCPVCGNLHPRGGTLGCYKTYLVDRCRKDAQFAEAIESLRGCVLGCFCKPKPCHGDIIIQYLNGELS